MAIRVFNADDHPLLRKGVTDLIIETRDLDWVGSAADGAEAIEKIRSIQPDVAILDIEMPNYSGIEVGKTLMGEGISTQFILLTLFKDESLFTKALDLGFMGYMLKESSTNEIIQCIHSVHRGEPYVNPGLTKYLLKRNQAVNDLFNKLSEHEINILRLIAKQKTTAEIADMLFISPKTVSNHRTNISKKLELSGEQNGLLKWAIKNRELLS